MACGCVDVCLGKTTRMACGCVDARVDREETGKLDAYLSKRC